MALQTDRQSGRETDRQSGRQSERQADSWEARPEQSYFQAALAAFLLPVNKDSLAARSLIILRVSWSDTGAAGGKEFT